MEVIATIRKTTVSEVPVTINAKDLSEAIAQANGAAAVMASAAGDGQATVERIQEAQSGRLLFAKPNVASPQPGHMEVVWRMQVAAQDHDHAASIARILQADPSALVSVFEVTDAFGVHKTVNLHHNGDLLH